MIGTWQLVLIFAIVLVLFGAGRIPKIMKDLGIGFRAFKKGIEGFEEDESIVNSNKTKSKKKNINNNKKVKLIKIATKRKRTNNKV